MKYVKNILKGLLALVILAAVIVGGYVSYVFLSYDRVEDRQPLTVEGAAAADAPVVGETYTVVTQNAGFGAYTADFTFFMDGGESSRAESAESVKTCIEGLAANVASFDPDFVLFQEIDTDSTRSFHLDEASMLTSLFPEDQSVFAVNYHSAYLMYPLTKPHGRSNSGLLTLSRHPVASALRRSLPISETVSKFLDLDRCYSVSRIPVSGGGELVLYNVHLSAYGGSDELRAAQMTMVFEDMRDEYEKGNYCVCGGDFNHDFSGDSTSYFNAVGATEFGWAQPFPADLLPEGISRCLGYDADPLIPTCRNCDVPYDEDTFVIIVDGFLLSDNVEAVSVANIDEGFTFSDHNPVVLRFRLKDV
ncbi:MAG: endonuclease/exonuclease/phosphatase family protein [Bacillota bacterium]|jgi:endonuclease/exonuclease/phosphatase family metal-dependent hydrolase